jgi:hypothetical protein
MSNMMTQEEAMNMSNEQAVQILIPMRNMMCDQNGCPISDAVFALDKAIEVLSTDRLQEWIQCKERLPREYEVLCCDIYKNYIVGHPFADDSASTGFCAESEGEFMYECVAWMPLPKPWKGADDETE